jgi:hypothetical protein
VHAAQVVAAPVLPGRRVVLAVHGHRLGAALAGARVLPGEPDRGQRDHLGDDRQPVDAGEGPGQLAQPERVGEPDHQRADLVPAADVGPQRVPDRAGLVRAEPLQHHPGAAAQRVRQAVLQQQGAGGQPGEVLQAQYDAGAGADRHPVRLERARAGQLVPAAPDVRRRQQRQHDQQDGDPQQVLLAEDHRGHGGGPGGGEEGAAPGAEPAKRLAHGHRLRRSYCDR